MKPANNAPVYAAMYTDLADTFRIHGYALAVHGSLARDFDLIAVPWVGAPTPPEQVVESIEKQFALKRHLEPTKMVHGRIVYTLSASFGEVFIDLSFTPAVDSKEEHL